MRIINYKALIISMAFITISCSDFVFVETPPDNESPVLAVDFEQAEISIEEGQKTWIKLILEDTLKTNSSVFIKGIDTDDSILDTNASAPSEIVVVQIHKGAKVPLLK